jgi:predicted nucleic acid-binding protein
VRAVFDTNIFISAFVISGGNADEAYLHAVRGTFELFTSVAILTETATTLQMKFQWSDEKVRKLLQAHQQDGDGRGLSRTCTFSPMSGTTEFSNAPRSPTPT